MRKLRSCLLLVIAWQSLANAQDLYTVTDLGTLGGSTSFALAINATGVVTGESDDGELIGPGYKGDYSRAFIFRKGMRIMQPIGPSPSGIGQAINVGNEIVGGNFIYKNGVTSFPSDSSVSFTGVNNSGEICGTVVVPQAGTLGNTNAMLFRNGVIVNLGTLGGPNNVALGLNNEGQIVGYFTLPSDFNNFHASLWQNGRIFDIGTLGPANDALNYYSEATAINDHGQIVGYSLTTSGLIDAFLWQNGVMRDLGVVPGINDPDRSISASAINNRGEIVGSQNNSSGVQSFTPNVAFSLHRGPYV
jgi:probable HAF family extracellular repeat protein